MEQLTIYDLITASEIAARPSRPNVPIGTAVWYANREQGRTEVVGSEWAGDVFPGAEFWYLLIRAPHYPDRYYRMHPRTEGTMWGFYDR